MAATQTENRRGDNLSYRAFVDYNADKYGVQVEHLAVEPNFLPEIGFVRRTDMRRNFGQLRYSARPTGLGSVRRMTTQARTTRPIPGTGSTRVTASADSKPSSPTATWPA